MTKPNTKPGRKTKCTIELCEAIFEAISNTGSHRAGWETGAICASTFYEWIKSNPEFSQGVADAMDESRQRRSADFVAMANDRLREALEVGHVVRWKKKEKRQQRVLSPSGEVLKVVETEVESENEERRPTPSWVFDRVLPPQVQDLAELEALAESMGLRLSVVNEAKYSEYLRRSKLERRYELEQKSEEKDDLFSDNDYSPDIASILSRLAEGRGLF